jgi:tRNA nucleotidyltransferase (CCA-adding enzyme)
MSAALARALCQQLRQAGHSAFVAGGWVRDQLLERPSGDLDLATSAHPEQVMALFDRVHPTGLKHGTVTVVVADQPVEITTYRAEGDYSDGRRPDQITFLDRIEEDLKRRDFTVNAIAWDPIEDRYIDPFDGMADVQTLTLRCVGRAEDRFGEDALRLLRAMRFAATHYLMPVAGLEEAMRSQAHRLALIAPERIERELSLLLERAERPSVGLNFGLRAGLIEQVLPELMPLVGQAQNRFHAYDCWDHTLAAVDAVPAGQTNVRWAALLHDLGKPPSAEQHPDRPDEYRFFGHEQLSVELTEVIAERLRFSGARRALISALVATHMLHPNDEWGDAAIRRLLRKIGPERLDDFLSLKRADIRAKGTEDVGDLLVGVEAIESRLRSELARGAALSRHDLAVDGTRLCQALDRAPGPWLGPLLALLLDWVTEDPTRNRPDALLARAKQELAN